LKLLGDIAWHQGPTKFEEAERYYEQALTLTLELGMRPLQAHCHVGLGHLYEAMCSAEKARLEFSHAIGLYRSMDMASWLSRAETSMTRLMS
jgi:hypothetical protein